MYKLTIGNNHHALDELQRCGIFVGRHNFSTRGEMFLESPIEMIGGIAGGHRLTVGAFSYSWSGIGPSIEAIGRYCSIAGHVTFAELEHPTTWLSTSSFTYDRHWMWERFAASRGLNLPTISKPDFRHSPGITIGNDVWIGLGAYIRGGVHLGDGCIIAAQSVVTKSVPPYAVVAGNPGKIVKFRFDEKTIARLLEIAWWKYSFTDLPLSNIDQVGVVLDRLEEQVSMNLLSPYDPPLYHIGL